MKEFIINETVNIFTKAIAKYSALKDLEYTQCGIRISLIKLKDEDILQYTMLVNGIEAENVTLKQILGVKTIDFKGYTLLLPPYLIEILLEFILEFKTNVIEIGIFIDNKDELRFFVYENKLLRREIYLKDIIKIK
jgi:hypothetical protein